jgi:adenylosuccinate synthase
MPATCVVGLQWGDEAKGKIVDRLADSHDFVVRYNGGANAGHTVVWGERRFALSLLPTGVLKPNVVSVIGNGVVVYPQRFVEEVSKLRDAGIMIGDNLKLSDRAHVIFPWHLEEERLAEADSAGKIGTTGRGIGPCYADKVGRRHAIRVGDLLDADYFRDRLAAVVPHKNRLLKALHSDAASFEIDTIAHEYGALADVLRPHVTDTVHLLHDGLVAGKGILFEAAQGSLLDIDHGTFPYVTSSHSLPGGIANGTGIPARAVDRIIGIAKAYTSRVGRGPFPTEQDNAIGERIRQVGREFGTVTGRPRRCGWFDAVAVNYTAMLAGVDEIAVMLLDVLSGHESLNICTAYDMNGARTTRFPSDARHLERCTPIYETLPGWSDDITRCRSWTDLPANARNYVDRISVLIGKPVRTVSVGPDRDQTIERLP